MGVCLEVSESYWFGLIISETVWDCGAVEVTTRNWCRRIKEATVFFPSSLAHLFSYLEQSKNYSNLCFQPFFPTTSLPLPSPRKNPPIHRPSPLFLCTPPFLLSHHISTSVLSSSFFPFSFFFVSLFNTNAGSRSNTEPVGQRYRAEGRWMEGGREGKGRKRKVGEDI